MLLRQAGRLHCIAASMARPDVARNRSPGGRYAWTSSIRVFPTAWPAAGGMAVRSADCEVPLDAVSEAREVGPLIARPQAARLWPSRPGDAPTAA